MKRRNHWILLAVFFVAQGFMQRAVLWDRWVKDYAPKASLTQGTGLSPDQMLFALAGFREMVAGILWVRADSFFDAGNYDAVLPIIRLVTILDPKQIDVYTTGMWHIGYNFTDEDERSDRRYVPSALALGKEGARQNPDTYELFFELGWMWFNKVDDDYPRAVHYFEDVEHHKDAPAARRHLLSAAYQRNGQVQEALDHFYKLKDDAEATFKDDPSFGNGQMVDSLTNNIDTLLVRMTQRGFLAQKRGDKDLSGYDTQPPFDVNFSAKATVVEPRVIKFEGTWNVLPVGTRIRVVLRDAAYPGAALSTMDWDGQTTVNLDPPRDSTYMQDTLFVKNRKFTKTIDMSKDPTMYPFRSDKYILEFYYNPRSAPNHIQDKFGWNGEGMTDKNFLNTTLRPGTRIVFTSFDLSRDEILRLGDYDLSTGKVPSVKTTNFKEATESGSKDDVIFVPALRTGGK